jgi:formylglycine-generating enzyme required for sulfatase activity
MKRFIQLLSAIGVMLLFVGFGQAAGPQIEMVKVKGGCYKMGDTFGKGNSDEKPVHEVCVSDFSIGKYLVTQAEWKAVMGTSPSKFTGDRLPVDSVSWDDTQEFITNLNLLTGKRYRHPTEAEWEYAARSGGKNETWAGTSDGARLSEYAWYKDNSARKTHVVGSKKPNGLGLYDMSGNVWEWVQDRYDSAWYGESPRDNPQGPMTGSYRVQRGGSWFNTAVNVRASHRYWREPSDRDGRLGFRLALPATR